MTYDYDRVTLNIDKEALKKLRELAIQDDRSLSKYISKILKNYINQMEIVLKN